MTDQEQPKRGRGRPATYASNAERAKAWRQRQKDLIAQAQTPAVPVVVEKIVEKVVEKIVRVPGTASSGRRSTATRPDADRLLPLLRNRFNGFQGVEEAKRFRTNAAKAATTARDLIRLLQRDGTVVPETEREFLQVAAQFFDRLNDGFANAQQSAKVSKAKAEKEYQAKQEAEISAQILNTFGPTPDPATVIRMAEDLLAFDKAANDYLTKKHHCAKAYLFLQQEFDLEIAIRRQNAASAQRIIAMVRNEIGEKGHRWTDRDETGYSAGWADFIEYRTNAPKPSA